jgi:Bacterial membrane protein YfhO
MASHARSRGRAGVAAFTSRIGERLLAIRDSRFTHALIAHQHRTAAALLALLVLVYLWPALIGGGTLAPLALLYQTAPWTAFAPNNVAGYYNPALFDVTLSYYPWDVLARDLIRSGTFPAWNPHALAGTPFFTNPEVGWLSPFNLPLWTLPLNWALGFVAAIKLWVAGFGAYLLGRELRLGFWPGLLAGVSFALCAFHVIWLSHSAFTSVSVLFPWLLLLVERIVRRGRPLDGLLLTGVVAVVLAGGHPGTQVHVLGATVLYALLRVALIPDLVRADRLRRLGLVGAGCALGALLMTLVLLPAQQGALDSAGAAARRGGGTEPFNGQNMPFGVLRTALFPEWWGRHSETIIGTPWPADEAIGPANFNERTFYAGVVALLLATVGLVASWRTAWRRMLPFGALGVLGLAEAVEAPGLHWLVTHLPLFELVQNQRIALWFQLAVAVLAAFGLQWLLEARRRSLRPAWAVVAAAGLAALVAVASIEPDGEAIDDAVRWVLTRDGPVDLDGVALASVVWWVVLAAGLAGVLALLRARPRWIGLAGALVVLGAALDMLHFSHGYQSMGPASKALPPRTDAIAFLQDRNDQGRIAGLDKVVAYDWSTVYGLRDARGYDAPQPSLRYHRLWRAAVNPDQLLHTGYGFSSLESGSLKVLGMLGARWIAARPDVNLATQGLTPAYRGDDAAIFENELAVPRAFATSSVEVADDEDAELVAILHAGFDPRREVVVRRDELDGTPPPSGDGRAGSVRVVSEENARVTLRADLARRAVVVLDDAWARGWRVEVDGRPARPLQADMVLRGVIVPAGEHEIVWSYRVPGLRVGAALSAVGLAIAAGWASWLALRTRRARRFPVAPQG